MTRQCRSGSTSFLTEEYGGYKENFELKHSLINPLSIRNTMSFLNPSIPSFSLERGKKKLQC